VIKVIGNIVQSQNVASINNYGISASWQGSSLDGKLRYGANLTWTSTRMHEAGVSRPLTAAPTLLGNAHIAYQLGGYLPTAAFAVQAMGTRAADRTAPNGAALAAAPAFANLHLALTGRIPLVPELGYVLSADYITANRGPYMVGPDLTSVPALQGIRTSLPAPGYVPVDQLRIMIGLRLDFLTGKDTAEAP
jgi:hypothetical protein